MLVTLAAAGTLAGCGSVPVAAERSADAGVRPGQATPLDPDVLRVRNAIAAEERLLALTTATARRHRAARAVLAPAIAGQAQHVRRLRGSLTDLDPPPARSRPHVPPRAEAALAAVARQAAAVRDARLADCRDATAGLLAELLGSIAASHAVTIAALTQKPPPTAPTPALDMDDVDPLQLCLAGEHAAVYGYGLLGGVLSAGISDAPIAAAARASYAVHVDRRDQLTDTIRTGGPEPVASAAAYDVPTPVSGPVSASRLAQQLEGRCAGLYAQAVAALPSGERAFVSQSLLDCAVRAVSWGAEPSAFPGLDTP